jgi:hypothetical protein
MNISELFIILLHIVNVGEGVHEVGVVAGDEDTKFAGGDEEGIKLVCATNDAGGFSENINE